MIFRKKTNKNSLYKDFQGCKALSNNLSNFSPVKRIGQLPTYTLGHLDLCFLIPHVKLNWPVLYSTT